MCVTVELVQLELEQVEEYSWSMFVRSFCERFSPASLSGLGLRCWVRLVLVKVSSYPYGYVFAPMV